MDITRKEFPHGWQVSFKMDGLIAKRAIQRKWFGDKTWGGKESALRAAEKYRDNLLPKRRKGTKKQEMTIIREVGKVWGWRVGEKLFSDNEYGDKSFEAAENFLKNSSCVSF
jgi:hypothetical protein